MAKLKCVIENLNDIWGKLLRAYYKNDNVTCLPSAPFSKIAKVKVQAIPKQFRKLPELVQEIGSGNILN